MPKRFLEIDGMRAIACLLVVIHHTCTSAAASAISEFSLPLARLWYFTAASGVECFFALSGFLLLYPYMACGKHIDPYRYVKQRFMRLVPPFFVAWLFAGVVQFISTNWPTWYSNELVPFALWDWIYRLDILTLVARQHLYNGAWWSLSIECLWYMIVPAVAVLSGFMPILRTSTAWMLATFASMLAVFTYAPEADMLPRILAGFGVVFERFFLYATCFTSALWLIVYRPRIEVVFSAALLGISVILFCCVANELRGIHCGFALVWSATIAACMRLSSPREALASPLLVWLGDRSYSLFLTHMTVFVLTNWVVSHYCDGKTAIYGVLTRIIGLPLALMAAMILFWFIERNTGCQFTTGSCFWPRLRYRQG
jgi:peptidoglycan/LPS O-acetylase OafA/YrhL